MSDPGEQASAVARVYAAAAPWFNAVWRFIGPVALGVGAGWFIDAKMGTGPWGLVGGSTVGIALGFTAFLITTTKMLGKKQ